MVFGEELILKVSYLKFGDMGLLDGGFRNVDILIYEGLDMVCNMDGDMSFVSRVVCSFEYNNN